MQLSSAEKALYVKIVYYGPGLSGKTTNLESLHALTDPNRQQPMVSLKTEQDRTLFFDLLPFDLGKLYGLDVRLKLYTVPGQIQYDTTRKQVLAGADGVVFVADSDPMRRSENLRMIRYLKNNLEANGLDPAVIPMVLQWNKRDLPSAMSPIELEQQLNWRRVPTVESVATTGKGVIETFQEIVIATLQSLALRGRAASHGDDTVRAHVTSLLAPYLANAAKETLVEQSVAEISHVHQQAERVAASEGDDRHREVLGLDDLLSEAVQANLNISEQLSRASGAEDQLLARLKREKMALSRMLQIAHVSADHRSLYKIAISTLAAGLDLEQGSALAAGPPGQPMHEIAVVGHAKDPLNNICTPGIGSVAAGLLERGETYLCHDIDSELLFGHGAPGLDRIRSMLALPLSLAGGATSLILLYSGREDRDISKDDVEFAELILAVLRLALRALPVPARV